MKSGFFLILLLTSICFSQNVGVKVDGLDANQDTTIEIKKGSKGQNSLYEITEGEENIEGDPAPLLKEARTNWKKACRDWKNEFKEMNKENSIISAVCGKMNCTTQAMESTCSSKATYKVKIKIN